ncbi:MAG: hypothetical protein V3S26_07720 [Acidimicrobiia bacterium]|jgi:hypothetical protein
MADSYSGPVRILGGDGILLTTGVAALEADSEMGNWKGALQTLIGTAVAGKALVVEIEIPGGERGRAQLTPSGQAGERYTSDVTGLSRQPF